jgi:hypothetical protein
LGNGEIRPRDLIAEAATVRGYIQSTHFLLPPIGSFADHASNTIFPFPLPPCVFIVCHKSPGHSAAEEGREYVNPFFCLSVPSLSSSFGCRIHQKSAHCRHPQPKQFLGLSQREGREWGKEAGGIAADAPANSSRGQSSIIFFMG